MTGKAGESPQGGIEGHKMCLDRQEDSFDR